MYYLFKNKKVKEEEIFKVDEDNDIIKVKEIKDEEIIKVDEIKDEEIFKVDEDEEIFKVDEIKDEEIFKVDEIKDEEIFKVDEIINEVDTTKDKVIMPSLPIRIRKPIRKNQPKSFSLSVLSYKIIDASFNNTVALGVGLGIGLSIGVCLGAFVTFSLISSK